MMYSKTKIRKKLGEKYKICLPGFQPAILSEVAENAENFPQIVP